MTHQKMIDVCDQLGRRWEMARKLGCGPETVAVLADAYDAANKIVYRIENARRVRVGGGS